MIVCIHGAGLPRNFFGVNELASAAAAGVVPCSAAAAGSGSLPLGLDGDARAPMQTQTKTMIAIEIAFMIAECRKWDVPIRHSAAEVMWNAVLIAGRCPEISSLPGFDSNHCVDKELH